MKDTISLSEAKELYCHYNWSMVLCFKSLDENIGISLPEFSRLVIKEEWNKLHYDRLKELKTTNEKNSFTRCDVRKIRGLDKTLDEDCFFGDAEDF